MFVIARLRVDILPTHLRVAAMNRVVVMVHVSATGRVAGPLRAEDMEMMSVTARP